MLIRTLRASLIYLCLACAPASAFVILDTSGPSPKSAAPADTLPKPASPAGTMQDTAMSRPADTLPQVPVPDPARNETPRYRNVLFLSADSKLVYAYVGVLKALEEYGLAPDAILAESKAVIVGAAWALGYDARAIEKLLLDRPLESLLAPFPARKPLEDRTFVPDGRDPLQWDVPLSLQAFQTRSLKWTDVAGDEPGEYLHLSWAVAQLTHGAPGGPVEDLQRTPRRLAVQVSDLESSREAVATEGGLQNIIKGSLLPAEVVRRRARLWPVAPGSLLSGHRVMANRLPFACDRIIMIQPGRRLRPPALESGPLPWTDSLTLRAKARAANQDAETAPASLDAKAIRIELEPDGGFDPAETDPARWIALGYTSALRSMDVLKSSLAAPTPLPAPSASVDRDRLGLNRLSVNPLASGGRELLLDILRTSDSDNPDSGEDRAIAALTASGFYKDLDVEWARGSDQEKALLVFDAQDKSKVRFRAGWNAAYTGEDVVDRPPELFGGLAWSEPFYIPFEAEAGALLGGHRPGVEWRLMIAPVFPIPMELGIGWTWWQVHYRLPSLEPAAELGPLPVRFQRDLWQVFLNLKPSPRLLSRSIVQSHRAIFPVEGAPDDTLKSLDFRETVWLGLWKARKDGGHPISWLGRFRYINQINLVGQVKPPYSSVESRLRLAAGDFRLIDHYYWSDQGVHDLNVFDLMRSGRIDALSFQDEFFPAYLRSPNFQDIRLEYCPTWGRAGLRLMAGAWRHYGETFFAEQSERRNLGGWRLPGRGHWEAQAGYATPLGSLRVGLGGLDGEAPFYFVRLGSDLELGFGEGE